MKYHLAKTKFLLLSLLLLAGLQHLSAAQDFPKPFDPPRLVNDYIQLLDNQQLNLLETKLRKYNDTTSNEIAVVIVDNIGGDDIALYAAGLAEKWGIGKKKKNNGVLLLVALSDRKVSISPGYGLEGVIPDAYAKRIIEKYITPNFGQKKYFEGIDQATSILMSLASGEFKADKMAGSKMPGLLILLFVLIAFIFPLFRVFFLNKNNHYSSKPAGLWGTLWLLSQMNNGRGSSFDDFSSGGGMFGGSNFGGFGGGGFGGGGASGSW